MAGTTSNPAKGLQQNRARPVVPRTVIPAIPLPYVQKRQKQQEVAAALAKSKEVVQTQTHPATPSLVKEASPKTLTPQLSPIFTNGTLESASEEKEEEEAEQTPSIVESTEAAKVEEQIQDQEEHEAEPEPESEAVAQAQNSESREPSTSTQSEGHSEGSRSTYQLPPPFVPTSNGQAEAHINAVRFPPPHLSFSSQHPLHHAHPSTGSLMFGGYPESNNSSPAPPISAGNAPSYPPAFPLQQAGGRHFHQMSNGGHPQPHGFSPVGPPPGYYPRQDSFVNPSNGPDPNRRPYFVGPGNLSFGAPEGYSPSPTPLGADGRHNGYDPSTPHSVPGSQSSTPAEQENGPTFYGQYPTAVISNGSNGHVDEVRLYQQSRPKPRNESQQFQVPSFPTHPNGQPPLPVDHLDGLVNYLQSQFADPSLADYTLELRYSDDRAAPVRIPGHNIMFARSPTLKNIMSRQAHSDELAVRTLLIESDDSFLRSDSFWMAVQRLYGGPLLDLGVLAAVAPIPATQSSALLPGTPADRFFLALGYAAAGRILQIGPVVSRGIEIASHYINWNTVEKALDFALEGGLDPQWASQNVQVQEYVANTYGPATNGLIHSALSFIITSFPPGFELDATVPDATRSPRLPSVPEDRPSGPNPRLSFIKFGDHPTEEAAKTSSSDHIAITLSKILLNLPFHLLKYVLESSRLGNVAGWATASLRQEIMRTVVDEREKRRLRVHSSSTTDEERSAHAREWDAVGWQESVQSHPTPALGRTWVQFTTQGSSSG